MLAFLFSRRVAVALAAPTTATTTSTSTTTTTATAAAIAGTCACGVGGFREDEVAEESKDIISVLLGLVFLGDDGRDLTRLGGRS